MSEHNTKIGYDEHCDESYAGNGNDCVVDDQNNNNDTEVILY